MRAALLLLVAALSNAALLWTYHDRYWFVVDEGNYAHIAERLLDGEVLHRDVQDLHPGFINFVNTAAFRLFGTDLVSLRYPLMAAMLALSLVVWWLLARRSLRSTIHARGVCSGNAASDCGDQTTRRSTV